MFSKYHEQETKITEAFTTVGVNVTDQWNEEEFLINSFRAKLFPENERHIVSLMLAAISTSAAPTYFPEVFIKNGQQSSIDEYKK